MRRSARAPIHPWVGRFICPICGEPFAFAREQEGLTGTEDAYLQVAHVHTGEDAIWTGSVFRPKKGGGYPEDVEVLRLTVQEQNRSVKERKS